jgi:hypothetical protein
MVWHEYIGRFEGTLITDRLLMAARMARATTMWRKIDGTPAGSSAWRTHFGQPASSGSSTGVNAAVPEPATLVLLMFAAAGRRVRRGRAA